MRGEGLNKPTPTQLRYLVALGNGLSMSRIATLSNVEYGTVRSQFANVRDRLGTTNNVASVLVCIAYEWLAVERDGTCKVLGDPEGWDG